MPKQATKKRAYNPPDGWTMLSRVHAEILHVKESNPAAGVICGIFNAIWKDYTKKRPAKRQLRELCIAVNPKWLRAALKSEEMKGQPVKGADGKVMIYGFRVREEASLEVSDIAVEEKQE